MRFHTVIALAFVGSSMAKPTTTQKDQPTKILEKRGPTGINNRGSALCKSGSMQEIYNYLQNVPNTQVYSDQEHIACSGISYGLGGTCAFAQGTGGLTGWEVKLLIKDLYNHYDTKGCGSVPVTFPEELGGYNNFNSGEGMLTVNYVANTDNPCPPGVCGATAC